MSVANEPAVVAILALLGGSGGKLLFDFYKEYRSGPPKELRQMQFADANLTLVTKARDELIEDIVRLRQERAEQDARHSAERAERDARHAEERAQWLLDREGLRADVARLEAQIRTERDEANLRYDALLAQIRLLGARTDEMKDRQDG